MIDPTTPEAPALAPNPAAAAEPAAEKPRSKPFRRNFAAARPEPEMVNRQMEATRVAFLAFGNAESARSFLNEADADLGGRPLDVAGASVEGLRRVVELTGKVSQAPAQGG